MPDLTVLAANLHNSKAAARWLMRRSRADHADTFDVAFVCEAQKRRRMLKLAAGHRYHTGPAGMGDNDAGRETGILVRHGFPDAGTGSYFLSDMFPAAPAAGKERWGQVSVIRCKNAAVALVGLHPVAAPKALSRGDGGPLVDRHKAAVEWLVATIAHHRRLGHEVVVGGDLNIRPMWAGARYLTRVLDNHDMGRLWDGVDLIAWTPGLTLARSHVNRRALPDHPLLRVELNVL